MKTALGVLALSVTCAAQAQICSFCDTRVCLEVEFETTEEDQGFPAFVFERGKTYTIFGTIHQSGSMPPFQIVESFTKTANGSAIAMANRFVGNTAMFLGLTPLDLSDIHGFTLPQRAALARVTVPPNAPLGGHLFAYRIILFDGLTTYQGNYSYSSIFVVDPPPSTDAHFIRGDADGNGKVQHPDAILIIEKLNNNLNVDCSDAMDVNDDGFVDFSDVNYLFGRIYNFGNFPPIPPPNVCGPDPTAQDIHDCKGGTSCL